MKILSWSDLARFIGKLGLFLMPVALIAATFFIVDPFKVIYGYDDFYRHSDRPGVILNRGVVAAEIYLRHREKYGYDSFVFGSSRSLAFLTQDWKKYTGKSSPLHFDAAGESLFGVWSTLRWMDRTHVPVKNALLVLDPLLLKNTAETESLIGLHHPAISGMPRLEFYFRFLRGYLSGGFFISYWDLKLFKTYRPYMKNYIHKGSFSCDPVTNDCLLLWREEKIAENPEKYFSNIAVFYPRDHRVKREYKPVIKEKQRAMLLEIKRIFEKKDTDFKIIISPLYGQQKINPKDLEALQAVFGAGRVYDYSGVNALTNDVRNYYEPHHYRLDAARKILEEIYAVPLMGRSG